MFHKIQVAYELLQPTVKRSAAENKLAVKGNFDGEVFSDADMGGLNITRSQLFPTWLLMKTQLLICRRHASEIGKFKYPYKMLLACLNPPKGDEVRSFFMSLGRAKFLRTAIDLLFHSCLVSPMNAEELIREGGTLVLANLLNCYVSFLASIQLHEISQNDELISLQMESLVHVVHTIAGIAYYENGRIALEALPSYLRICQIWRKCIDLRFVGQNVYGSNLLKRFALEGILSMAKSEKLQVDLASSGVVWNLIHSMLDYDPKLELISLETEKFEKSISQVELNYFGGVATRALGMLCGVMKEEFVSPLNLALFEALQQVLTKPIAKMLRSSDSEDTLRTLNLSIETPLRLWDLNMRKELMSFLSMMEAKDPCTEDLATHLEAAESFEYSNLSDEVNIGGVYIRIFNNMDVQEATKEIADISHFARSLIAFIGRSILKDKESTGALETSPARRFLLEEKIDDSSMDPDKESVWYPLTDARFPMCVQALLQLVKRDGLIDDVMCEPHSAGVIISMVSLSCQKVSALQQMNSFKLHKNIRSFIPFPVSSYGIRYHDAAGPKTSLCQCSSRV
jgi:hypothetical protein